MYSVEDYKKFILQSLIEKGIVDKHWNYFQRINTLLKDITDTEEEYTTLKNDVHQFYLEVRKQRHERLIAKTKKGEFFDNPFGSTCSVEWTEEMMDASGNLLYTGHNHPIPDGNTCFQSYTDIENILRHGIKYSWTFGKDGFMIIKGNTATSINFEDELFKAYSKVIKPIRESYHKDKKNELDALKKKYPKWDDCDELDSIRFEIANDELFNKYFSKDIETHIKDLGEVFKKEHIGLKCYYAKNGK